MAKSQKTLWGGRFSTSLTTETIAFTHSIEADTRLIGYDIWGSQAHAVMLARQRIISDADLREILHWLRKAEEDFQNGHFVLDPNKEDVHMNVESYLIENAGREFGGKLHTARSRNDQVLVDAHLYIRDEILNVQRGISELCKAFLHIAKAHINTVMPGYTHTQHAQPISLGFWATADVSMFLRDQKRLQSASRLANMNPLGSCALAGTTFPIDRELTTKLLGFDTPHEHALDVISSRDFIAEVLFGLSLVMANLSRISEEIVYWTTYEFGMAVLDDAYSFGSSIMPQKKNPDIAELTRGRTGRVYGALLDLLTNLKGLPMGYNRDFQEDKPPLWEAFDVVKACLGMLPELLKTTDFKTERMAELANANFATATELANYLAKDRQMSFRECHEVVGWLVGELVQQEKTFSDWELTHTLLKQKEIAISVAQLKQILDAELALENNQSLGGTSPAEVHRMIDNFEEQLNAIALNIYNCQTHIDDARQETLRIVDAVLEMQITTTEGEQKIER
ncbi:MAG: argininosuccinate lyase [Candidatus Poribacteria bacterium]|nr:argininosuccinate lyase [Candidatus Poribacteria bacterium]